MILPFLLLAVRAMPAWAVAAEPNFPALSGRVVDDAGILNDGTIQNLTGMLEKHEQATGEQVVVVTLKSLGGYAIEDYDYQLGRKWGIGQKGKNTGAMLIVVPSEPLCAQDNRPSVSPPSPRAASETPRVEITQWQRT
jgi:uncharacterized protein